VACLAAVGAGVVMAGGALLLCVVCPSQAKAYPSWAACTLGTAPASQGFSLSRYGHSADTRKSWLSESA
jgi:hypothetical protein